MRKKKNHIPRIKIGNQILTKVVDAKKGIRDHFVVSFTHEQFPNIQLPPGTFKQNPTVVANQLETIPCAVEITRAVWSCDPSKALGYDGFNIKFVKIF